MIIVGMLCPHCGDDLTCEKHRWPEYWIGSVYFSLCEPCERFFYILIDETKYPIAVIDAEHGIGEGDEGYSFDQIDHGDADDWHYYQQWLAKQPKCAICGVKTPLDSCDRCQKCVDRFGVGGAVQA
jgi:hypothetical protein